jgi:tetratricopeptide (TPR) repeat protein
MQRKIRSADSLLLSRWFHLLLMIVAERVVTYITMSEESAAYGRFRGQRGQHMAEETFQGLLVACAFLMVGLVGCSNPSARRNQADVGTNAWASCTHIDPPDVDLDLRISGCTTAIQTGPQSPDILATAFNNRGEAYLAKHDFDRAIEDLNSSTSLNSNDVSPLINRGVAYFEKHEYDRAMQDFNRAITLQPDHAGALHNRGRLYSALLEYDRAIADFDQAIKLRPDYAAAYNDRGYAYASKAYCFRAISDFDAAVRLKPKFTGYYINLGGAFECNGDFERAIDVYDQILRLKPDFSDGFKLRCRARAHAGKSLEAALLDCNEALRLQPNDVTALELRSFLYFRMARYEDAIADCSESLKRSSKSAAAHYTCGLAKNRGRGPGSGNADISSALGIDSNVALKFESFGVKP